MNNMQTEYTEKIKFVRIEYVETREKREKDQEKMKNFKLNDKFSKSASYSVCCMHASCSAYSLK